MSRQSCENYLQYPGKKSPKIQKMKYRKSSTPNEESLEHYYIIV